MENFYRADFNISSYYKGCFVIYDNNGNFMLMFAL